MRILIVHNQLWAHYKAIIFNELQKIVTSKNNDELLVIQLASIEKSRLNLGNLDTTIHQYPYELIHDGVLEEVGLVQKIKGIIKSIKTFKPDIVNLTGYYDVASWVVLFYCRLKGIKMVLSNESTQGDHSREQHKELIKSLIIRQFDGYFNFGTLSKNYLISLGGKPEKMLVNRNCVDNEALKKIYDSYYPQRNTIQQKIGTAKHNFIFVGRLIEFKNLFKFLEAFKNTSPKPDWGIIILGDGELKPKLQQYAVEKNIPNVQFLKGVSWQEVPQYLAISDVLVLPSYSEPWGLVVNEAMACGLPVLVSEKCGCAIDLVQNEKNGYTFSPSDTEELSNLMQKCMENPTHLQEMGKKSKQIIASYSPQNVAQEMYEGFLAVYNN
ncbi:MAG: glycosyltransferase family 4 protein [Arcicella sp.]|jgi:glycosyltransferase involved in cell wall biosynthesis|nr:glycosyltransferase family 4 protein [Arcicella sp.]